MASSSHSEPLSGCARTRARRRRTLLAARAISLVALLLASPLAEADEADAGFVHRLSVDLAPYTAWARFVGDLPSDGATVEEDSFRGAFAVGLQWEVRPIPFLGLGVRVDMQLPADSPNFLLFLPQAVVRGILPLQDGRLELFLMAHGGAAYLQYSDEFVGWGWCVAGSLGASYAIGSRWGIQAQVGYLHAIVSAQGSTTLHVGEGARGLVGLYTTL